MQRLDFTPEETALISDITARDFRVTVYAAYDDMPEMVVCTYTKRYAKRHFDSLVKAKNAICK